MAVAFLIRPVPGPLELEYEKFGIAGYLPALAILVVFIILITYGLMRMIRGKSGVKKITVHTDE